MDAPYQKLDQLPSHLNWDNPRIQAMLSALETLADEGNQVVFFLDGPFTVLSILLPMGRMFALLRKPSGKEMLELAESWICEYAQLLSSRGVKMFSVADPVATLDILGEKLFVSQYTPFCKRLLNRLRMEHPQIPIHLCGKMTQSLLDVGACRIEKWIPDASCQTYGQVLTSVCRQRPGVVIGHFCLNFLESKRLYLELVDF